MPNSDSPGRKPTPGGDKPALPRRFYKEATAEPADGGYVLALDGRPARTPGRNPLRVPGQALGAALAVEWNAQEEVIDPARMPLTRLANSAIDGVAPNEAAVREDMLRYASSDLVCYRAGEPDRLVAAQAAAWDPVLAWAREALGAIFVMSAGISFVRQPEIALARVQAALEAETSPFALAAIHVMTSLTGSVLLALMHAAGAIGAEEAWTAAHVDETYQQSLWGVDHEAAVRQDARWQEFRAASDLLRLSRLP